MGQPQLGWQFWSSRRLQTCAVQATARSFVATLGDGSIFGYGDLENGRIWSKFGLWWAVSLMRLCQMDRCRHGGGSITQDQFRNVQQATSPPCPCCDLWRIYCPMGSSRLRWCQLEAAYVAAWDALLLFMSDVLAAAVSPCGRLTLQGPAVENGAPLSRERVVLLGKCFVA